MKKESIRLRVRPLASGAKSLYLDIYRNGDRHYEFLKLYLIPEKTKADKEANKQTMMLAEGVRAKRQVELMNGEYGFNVGKDNVLLFPYAERIARMRGREGSKATESLWLIVIKHLHAYEPNDRFPLCKITAKWAEGFKSYLDNYVAPRSTAKEGRISQWSKQVYFSKFKALITMAMRDGILSKDPTASVRNFKTPETERSFLSIDEVRLLASTPTPHEDMRRAFLFSCLTGLRWSDVCRLTWAEVDGNRLTFTQKKTGGLVYLDINEQAVALLGERAASPSTHVFPLSALTSVNVWLKAWVESAGISKRISFHCARHTFAVMMLGLGTDIYTVSKLLGHRNLTTTQVYAKVLDRSKQEAVARIPSIL